LEKRCRILPDGGLGVSPNFKKPPRLGDIGVDQDYSIGLFLYIRLGTCAILDHIVVETYGILLVDYYANGQVTLRG
jgi:hypothetical protein